MITPHGHVADVVCHILLGRRKATKYVSPSMVVKATARYKPRRGARSCEIVVTVGTPNYAERDFIRDAKKAGERFPLRRVQVKEWK